MITCCEQEMIRADNWYHCRVCGKRLMERPYGKDQQIIADMVVEYVHDYSQTWKEMQHIFHELWRVGYYEDYKPKVPDAWQPT